MDWENGQLHHRQLGISVTVNPTAGVYSVKYKSEQWMGNGFVSVLANGR
jgi:hypothetical protein